VPRETIPNILEWVESRYANTSAILGNLENLKDKYAKRAELVVLSLNPDEPGSKNARQALPKLTLKDAGTVTHFLDKAQRHLSKCFKELRRLKTPGKTWTGKNVDQIQAKFAKADKRLQEAQNALTKIVKDHFGEDLPQQPAATEVR
jgi:ribosomal 50S subunit-associated protein YjgA (DUF615 family)